MLGMFTLSPKLADHLHSTYEKCNSQTYKDVKAYERLHATKTTGDHFTLELKDPLYMWYTNYVSREDGDVSSSLYIGYLGGRRDQRIPNGWKLSTWHPARHHQVWSELGRSQSFQPMRDRRMQRSWAKKSRDRELVRAQKNVSKVRPKTPP